MFRLPRLTASARIAETNGLPSSSFQQYWQTVVQRIEEAIQAIVTLTGITDQFEVSLSQAQAAIVAAQSAADAANMAAADAAATAAAAKRESALNSSYIEPDSVLTATATTITIANHTRHYGDGSSVAVMGGTVAATAAGDVDYVYYIDADRSGGPEVYQVATTNPAQTGDTHVVGAVAIPTTGTANGGTGPRKPGYVEAQNTSA